MGVFVLFLSRRPDEENFSLTSNLSPSASVHRRRIPIYKWRMKGGPLQGEDPRATQVQAKKTVWLGMGTSQADLPRKDLSDERYSQVCCTCQDARLPKLPEVTRAIWRSEAS